MGEKYAECYKTHERLGGKIDGCKEFCGNPNSWLSQCQGCGCHRSFHRKMVAPVPSKTGLVYTACQKIHFIGFRLSVDGCQQFRPSGGDGTVDALKCAVCGCDRDFHSGKTRMLPEASTTP